MDQNRSSRPAGIPPSMRRPAPSPQHAPRPNTSHAPRPHHQSTTPPPPPPPARPQHTSPQPQPPKPRRGIGKWIAIVVALLVAAAVVMFVWKVMTGRYNEFNVKSGANNYQAVFLSNNMVYFGHLSQVDGDYVKMSDIYYLQVQNQQGQTATGQTQQTTAAQPQLSLTKLGGELHGPEDTMYINKREILFWENLKPDGKVTQAIKDYKNTNKK